MFPRPAFIAIAIVACLASPVLAQPSPEAVAVAYFDAIKSDGFAAAADYIHPDELRRFKDMISPVLADANSPSALGFARAVFGPQATVESVSALDPLSFMRGFMNFVDGQVNGLDITVGDVQVLGAVPEGETVHLVTRNAAGAAGMQVVQLEVLSLRPYEDTWKLLLSGQIEDLAQALSAKAAEQP